MQKTQPRLLVIWGKTTLRLISRSPKRIGATSPKRRFTCWTGGTLHSIRRPMKLPLWFVGLASLFQRSVVAVPQFGEIRKIPVLGGLAPLDLISCLGRRQIEYLGFQR